MDVRARLVYIRRIQLYGLRTQGHRICLGAHRRRIRCWSALGSRLDPPDGPASAGRRELQVQLRWSCCSGQILTFARFMAEAPALAGAFFVAIYPGAPFESN